MFGSLWCISYSAPSAWSIIVPPGVLGDALDIADGLGLCGVKAIVPPVLGVHGGGGPGGVLGDAFEPAMGIGPCDDGAAPLYTLQDPLDLNLV